jgi:D-lactate dehydrogenase
MKAKFFSVKEFEREALTPRLEGSGVEADFLETRLGVKTAGLAKGSPIVSVFVNDVCDEDVLRVLSDGGTELLALRSAGFNHVDLEAADRLGITVARVPAYSPSGVAEHAAALLLALNRKLHKAYNRAREGNFSIDGLMGFDLNGKTVGVIGTGKIGVAFARIARGFGCDVLGHDPYENDAFKEVGGTYVELDELLGRSRIVSLHCPLTPETHHLIDAEAIGKMAEDAVLINTSRGGLVDTKALIGALKQERLGAVGIDVYEEEESFFFRDLSTRVLTDDLLARLLTFPNVLVTSHQGFFTHEAVEAIADVTAQNLRAASEGGPGAIDEDNIVRAEVHA